MNISSFKNNVKRISGARGDESIAQYLSCDEVGTLMSASSGSPPRQPHIPAWKRLGLKLKYANEHPIPHPLKDPKRSTASGHLTGDNQDRNRSNNDVLLAKKRRTSLSLSEDVNVSTTNGGVVTSSSSVLRSQATSRETVVDHDFSPSVETQHEDDPPANENPPLEASERNSAQEGAVEPRRKSVTFSPDTKQEGAFGASALLRDRNGKQKLSADQARNQPVVPSAKKSKKQKNRVETTQPASEASSRSSQHTAKPSETSGEVPEYLTYLLDFHTDRSSWKFNKNKQKDLLKNLFRIDRIPLGHDQAILEYICGLQGAGARRRLVENALSVLQEIAAKYDESQAPDQMESEEARRTAYRVALQRHLERYEKVKVTSSEYDDEQVEEMGREAEKGKRADAVLRELLQNEISLMDRPAGAAKSLRSLETAPTSGREPQDSVQNGNKYPAKSISKRKRRKARTQGPSGDSGSDASESEGDYNAKRGPSTVHDAISSKLNTESNSSPHLRAPTKSTGKRKIFDDEFLDQIFPKKQSYHDTAPKRKKDEQPRSRGFAYTHGTRADESGSDDD